MFDLTAYELVRSKYSAHDAFPHLFDKVRFDYKSLGFGVGFLNTTPRVLVTLIYILLDFFFVNIN